MDRDLIIRTLPAPDDMTGTTQRIARDTNSQRTDSGCAHNRRAVTLGSSLRVRCRREHQKQKRPHFRLVVFSKYANSVANSAPSISVTRSCISFCAS